MYEGFWEEKTEGNTSSYALVAPFHPAGTICETPCTTGAVNETPPRSGNSPQSTLTAAVAAIGPLQPVKAKVIHSTPSSLRGVPEGSGSSSVTL